MVGVISVLNRFSGSMGICVSCNKKRLVDKETGLCMPCEIVALKEAKMRLELEICTLKRKNRELAHTIERGA